MGEAWKREAEKEDIQLYKIHKPEEYKDTTEEWLTLSQTPNSKQTRMNKPLADNFRILNYDIFQ